MKRFLSVFVALVVPVVVWLSVPKPKADVERKVVAKPFKRVAKAKVRKGMPTNYLLGVIASSSTWSAGALTDGELGSPTGLSDGYAVYDLGTARVIDTAKAYITTADSLVYIGVFADNDGVDLFDAGNSICVIDTSATGTSSVSTLDSNAYRYWGFQVVGASGLYVSELYLEGGSDRTPGRMIGAAARHYGGGR